MSPENNPEKTQEKTQISTLRMLVRLKQSRHLLLMTFSTLMLFSVYQNCGSKNTTSSNSLASDASGSIFANPGAVYFPAATTSGYSQVTVYNHSQTSMANVNVTVPGPYFTIVSGLDGCSGQSLSPGTQCDFSVRYYNASSGIFQANYVSVGYAFINTSGMVAQTPLQVQVNGPGYVGSGNNGSSGGSVNQNE